VSAGFDIAYVDQTGKDQQGFSHFCSTKIIAEQRS
jgi:hypothetical protein